MRCPGNIPVIQRCNLFHSAVEDVCVFVLKIMYCALGACWSSAASVARCGSCSNVSSGPLCLY